MSEPDESDKDMNDWIESALKMVNGLRQFHAAPLQWSQECFEAAQRQAFDCEKQQRLFTGNTEGTSGTHGQNLYFSERPIDNGHEIENVIDAWYEFSEMYCFIDPGPTTGSEFLTQLLWASTEQFGLAVSDDGCYVVANFYPAGNITYRYDTNVHLPEYACPADVRSTGILFGSFPPSNLIVRKVFPDSWAQGEEIKEGDRFVAINGKMVPAMTKDDFSALIKERPLRLRLHVGIDQTSAPEEEVMNQVRERTGSIGRGKVELVAKDDVIKLGMVMSLPPRPLEVRKVIPGGWADQKGIELGDTFTKINGKPVWEISNDELVQILTTHIRPLVFRLATPEEHSSATTLQKNWRGKLDRQVSSAMMRLGAEGAKATSKDWRMARNRKAKLEKYEDENKDQELIEMQMPRDDLVARVYLALDDDKDKQLNEREMFCFARGLAFPDDTEAWTKEYADICTDFRLDEGQNISFEDFKDLVNEEGPYYCGYDRLNAILIEDEKKEAAIKMQASFRGVMSRKETANLRKRANEQAANAASEQTANDEAATKIQAKFRGKQGRKMAKAKNSAYEQDQKKAADVEETKSGRKIPKSNQKGNESAKASETTTSAAKVPQKTQDSQSSASKDVRKKVSQPQGATVKKDLQRPKGATIKAPEDVARRDVDTRSQVFSRYDADKDRRLNEQEMLAFARCLGYDGSSQAWSQEFRALCEEHGWDTAVGLDADAFKWLTTNPEDQYWFDADKLRDGGWEAAAGHPVQPERSKQKGLEPLSRAEGVRELEVPLQAEVAGLDWDQLEMDETLKAVVIQRICSAVAEKAGVNVDDLRVSLAPDAP